jgi:tellurite resistance protein TehA-like permease
MALDESARALVRTLKPDEIARLWMSENAVVNQKTAYFIAATAFLVSSTANLAIATGLKPPMVQNIGVIFLCFCGLIIAGVTYLSILRTCAYRDHLRECLELFDAYKVLLRPTFGALDGIRSSTMLTGFPLIAMLLWIVAIVLIVAGILRS